MGAGVAASLVGDAEGTGTGAALAPGHVGTAIVAVGTATGLLAAVTGTALVTDGTGAGWVPPDPRTDLVAEGTGAATVAVGTATGAADVTGPGHPVDVTDGRGVGATVGVGVEVGDPARVDVIRGDAEALALGAPLAEVTEAEAPAARTA